jgi:type VI secretion system secreted protein VgrG
MSSVITPLTVDLLIDGAAMAGVHVRGFTIREALSQPFDASIEVACKPNVLVPSTLLGSTISLQLELPNEKSRSWNGYVAGVSLLQADDDWITYRVRSVPKLWFLGRRSECRIFESKSTVDIVKDVLADAGLTVKVLSSGGTEKRTWCAQYRETDLNFISRLLEDAGICYYFEHKDSTEATMVLADSLSDHECFPGGDYDTIQFGGVGATGGIVGSDLLTQWSEHQVATSGKYTLHDYAFEKAQKVQDYATGQSASHQFQGYGINEFHADGEYSPNLSEVLKSRAKVRIEEVQSQRCRKLGQGDIRGIAVGSLFTLSDHPVAEQNVQHLVVSTTHTCSTPDLHSADQAASFEVSFEAIPHDLPYRPERVTPKPALDGLHTALVTQNDGSGCDWSNNGPMVRVKFFWDTDDAHPSQSGWARVAQAAASSGFGAMFLPQVGDEVVVSFLEGDPDRPLVIGSIYHGKNEPFYPQDKQLKQSGFRTKEGNEITFDEDVKQIYFKGKENLVLEAEKKITLKIGSTTIEMDDQGKITLTGKDVVIKANNKVEAEGTAGVSIKSSADVKVDGLNVTINGQVGAKVKGGATAEISASGPTTVKGAMVMIN